MKSKAVAILIYLIINSCSWLLPKEKGILKPFHEVEVNMSSVGSRLSEMTKKHLKKIKEIKGIESTDYQLAFRADSTTNAFVYFTDSLHALVTQISQEKGNDDISYHSSVMIDGGKATELKRRINNTRIALLSLLNETEQAKVKSDLVANDPSRTVSWETQLFKHSPAAAVATLLKKFENDAHNTNLQVLKLLLERENNN